MPGIVVMDGYCLNPGDLDWAPLASLGELTVYDRTPADAVVERAQGAHIVLTNKVQLDREMLRVLDDLRFISVLATGTDIVDLRAAAERNIVVSNAPGYGTASVAQLTWALLVELTHQVGRHDADVRAGGWARSPDFSYTLAPLLELEGLTLGIVGFGAIGRRVAAQARAFGMRVLVHTRTPAPHTGFEFVSLDAVLEQSDVVSLHCPLTNETAGLVSAERLGRMKPGALLVNTARGDLVDEPALARALRENRLRGAAVDVLGREPPPADHPLIAAPRCIVTPHLAWASVAARQRLMQITVDNVVAFLADRPINVCRTG